MKKVIAISVIIVVVVILIALIFDWGRRESKIPEIDTSASLTENSLINSSSTLDLPIVVNNIVDNQEVLNPLKIVGKAKGNWFFEATFPIDLVDTDGNILASTVATAEGDWMTADFVNFSATLDYSKATNTRRAIIVLNKDNPSGNPDLDQSIFIPVILK